MPSILTPERQREIDLHYIEKEQKLMIERSQIIGNKLKERQLKNRMLKKKADNEHQDDLNAKIKKFMKRMDQGEINARAAVYSQNVKFLQSSRIRNQKIQEREKRL